MCYRDSLERALDELSDLLDECEVEVRDSHDLLAVCVALKANGVPHSVHGAWREFKGVAIHGLYEG